MQAARRLHRRVVREREQLFLLEGPVVLAEAVQAGVELTDVFVDVETFADAELLEACAAAGAFVSEVGDNVLRALAATTTPQGVVAMARTPSFTLDRLPDEADLVLVLAQVRDPGNAGTLVRTAAAAGIACVVFTKGSTDPFGAKTVRASAGSIFQVPIARSTELEDALERLAQLGYMTVGTRADAPEVVYDVDLSGKVAIVVGNEAWGFGDSELPIARWASIPINDRVESLNVATAGAVILFEAVRQRRLSSARHG
ncbi:MAG: TrmH family RNA methyltransferase [Actinomycetota bacterium]